MKMKKYISLIATCLTAIIFYSCDYNDKNFDGLDELATPPNLASYEYTITDTDIATIASTAKASGNDEEKAMAEILSADKMFSESAPANKLVPFLLKSKYYTVDVKSSAKITYKYNEGRNKTVAGLTGKAYILGDTDYKSVWGDVFVNSFAPSKAPSDYLPKILKEGIESPEEGAYVNAEYFYSEEEPVSSIVEGETISLEKFDEGQTKDTPIKVAGWLNAKVAGKRTWDAKVYSDNFYAQMSSNGSKEINDIWLITPKTNLSEAVSPHLTFQVKIGYFNAECLSVLISENFDGNEANIATAKWDNITDKFVIPTEPTGGYGEFVSAGLGSLVDYKGKEIYIAFRYQGDDTSTPKKTTTYQLDDIKVCEAVIGLEVEEKNPVYESYTYTDGAWKKVGNDIIILQPEDYASMGLTYLSSAQAPNYLPTWLKSKYPYAQNGDSKVIVYKTNTSGSYYADELVYTDNVWTINSFVIDRTEQFVYSTNGWVFDPTFRETLQKGKGETDGYMMVVNYVRVNQAMENPKLISSYGDGEYYYGFSGNYGNVSYREQDRSNDTAYPVSATDAEKSAFMNQRTIEGLAVYLTLKYPGATPEVGGIEQLAEITVVIYNDPSSNIRDENWTYTMKCTGDKQWEFVQRESLNTGAIEKAE